MLKNDELADQLRKAIRESRKSTTSVGACLRISVDATGFGLPGVVFWLGLKGQVGQPSCNECYTWELMLALDVDWKIPGDFFTGFALRGSLRADVQVVEEPCAKAGADSTPYCVMLKYFVSGGSKGKDAMNCHSSSPMAVLHAWALHAFGQFIDFRGEVKQAESFLEKINHQAAALSDIYPTFSKRRLTYTLKYDNTVPGEA